MFIDLNGTVSLNTDFLIYLHIEARSFDWACPFQVMAVLTDEKKIICSEFKTLREAKRELRHIQEAVNKKNKDT